jgi:hypothetical protein
MGAKERFVHELLVCGFRIKVRFLLGGALCVVPTARPWPDSHLP